MFCNSLSNEGAKANVYFEPVYATERTPENPPFIYGLDIFLFLDIFFFTFSCVLKLIMFLWIK